MTRSSGKRLPVKTLVCAAVMLCMVLVGIVLCTTRTACEYLAGTFWLIAAVWAAYWLLGRLAQRRARLARRLRRLLSICLAVFLIWFGATEVYLIAGARTQTEPVPDYIVVLGAQVRGNTPSRALKDRVGAAAEYLKEHPETVAVVSGGQGPGENMTEAQCMYDLLIQEGIDAERIWLEDQAADTQQNLAFSLELIAEKTGTRPECLGVVSSEYHMRRACLVAQRQGVEAVSIAAPTSLLYAKVNYFIREAFGWWYYLLLR